MIDIHEQVCMSSRKRKHRIAARDTYEQSNDPKLAPYGPLYHRYSAYLSSSSH